MCEGKVMSVCNELCFFHPGKKILFCAVLLPRILKYFQTSSINPDVGAKMTAQRESSKMTQTQTARQPVWPTRGGSWDGVIEERGVQREAKLNDLRDTGSPQEAKRPSVILHTRAGSTPTFSLQPLFCWTETSHHLKRQYHRF